MWKFIRTLSSALRSGKASAVSALYGGLNSAQLQNLIGSEETALTSFDPAQTVTQAGYNSALTAVAGNLGGLYAESFNLWNFLMGLESQNTTAINSIKASVDSLSLQTYKVTNVASNNVTYTNNYVETFSTNASLDTNPKYYAGGSVDTLMIDVKDGLLKLPINGSFSIKPRAAYVDRVLGSLVKGGSPVINVFGSGSWNDVVQSDTIIYSQAAWLPSTYNGGAAVRVKVEFNSSSQFSELAVNPETTHAINLLGVGYANRTNNLLTDPNFSNGLSPLPSSSWYYNIMSYGVSGDGAAVLEGMEGSFNIVHLSTLTGTGAAFIKCGGNPLSNSYGGVEVSFYARVTELYPIRIGLTSYLSGTVAISDVHKDVLPECLGWTYFNVTFDIPVGAASVAMSVGIPPSMQYGQDLYVYSPFMEGVTVFPYYTPLGSYDTVFLPASVTARNIYLYFSQENAEFKTYPSHPVFDMDIGYAPGNSLSWSEISSKGNAKVIKGSNVGFPQSLSGLFRGVPGTLWELGAPAPAASSYACYEYSIGCASIDFLHREYLPAGRYVSKPISVNGEVREVRLEAADRYVSSPTEITYRITMKPDDVPENGKYIYNSQDFTASSNNVVYGIPPTSIDVTGYSSWSPSNSAGFYTYAWPQAPQQPTSFTQSVIAIEDNGAQQGDYVQKKIFTTPEDLRGASSVSFSYYAWGGNLINSYRFAIALSADGVSWEQQDFSVQLSDSWAYMNGELQFFQGTLNLSKFSAATLQAVTYMRIIRNMPNNGSYVSYGGYPFWLFFRNFIVTAFPVETSPSLFFIPSDDMSPQAMANYNTYGGFIAPVINKTETIAGTDRNGKVALTAYPYINRTIVLNLINAMSVNLGGRTVPYDPNAKTAKYLQSNGNVGTIPGYVPVSVSLYFPNTQVTVYPDILGKPVPNDIRQAVKQVLSAASSQQTTSSQSSQNLFVNLNSSSSTSSITTQRSYGMYQTLFTPILSTQNGVSFSAWWRSSASGSAFDAPIDPSYLSVNASQGLVSISAAPPSSGYDEVVASYWYVVGENSAREFFGYPGVTVNTPNASGYVMQQNYPVTRNMTDVTGGTTPVLSPPVLDPLDPNYYPVYEYYLTADGGIVFSQSLFTYGDTPAVITVNYSTLDINPRVIIDFTRPQQTNQTPYVDSYTLFINARTN